MPQDPAPISAAGFRMHTEAREGVTTVQCLGRLTSEHADALKMHVKGVFSNAHRVVLDFNELISMDSAGLGAIVGLYVSAKKANCELLLVNYNKSVRDLLGLTSLLCVFEDCARTGMRMP